jgi:hypothetical protein
VEQLRPQIRQRLDVEGEALAPPDDAAKVLVE